MTSDDPLLATLEAARDNAARAVVATQNLARAVDAFVTRTDVVANKLEQRDADRERRAEEMIKRVAGEAVRRGIEAVKDTPRWIERLWPLLTHAIAALAGIIAASIWFSTRPLVLDNVLIQAPATEGACKQAGGTWSTPRAGMTGCSFTWQR